MNRKLPISLGSIITICIILGAVSGLISSSAMVNAQGVLATVNVDVYADPELTQLISSLDWGTIFPPSVNNVTVYVKNTGSTAETLSMTTGNWYPTLAATTLSCTWNMEGFSLESGASVPATLSLSVPEDITALTDIDTSFHFDITITGIAGP